MAPSRIDNVTGAIVMRGEVTDREPRVSTRTGFGLWGAVHEPTIRRAYWSTTTSTE